MRSNSILTKEDVIAFWFEEISPDEWFRNSWVGSFARPIYS